MSIWTEDIISDKGNHWDYRFLFGQCGIYKITRSALLGSDYNFRVNDVVLYPIDPLGSLSKVCECEYDLHYPPANKNAPRSQRQNLSHSVYDGIFSLGITDEECDIVSRKILSL